MYRKSFPQWKSVQLLALLVLGTSACAGIAFLFRKHHVGINHEATLLTTMNDVHLSHSSKRFGLDLWLEGKWKGHTFYPLSRKNTSEGVPSAVNLSFLQPVTKEEARSCLSEISIVIFGDSIIGDILRAFMFYLYEEGDTGSCRRHQDDSMVFVPNVFTDQENQGQRFRKVSSECTYSTRNGIKLTYIRVYGSEQLLNLRNKISQGSRRNALENADYVLFHMFSHFFGYFVSAIPGYNESKAVESVVSAWKTVRAASNPGAQLIWLTPPCPSAKYADANNKQLVALYQSEERYRGINLVLMQQLQDLEGKRFHFIDKWHLTKSCVKSASVPCFTDVLHSTPIVNKLVVQIFLNYVCT